MSGAAPWVTPADAPHRKPESAREPVGANGFDRVLGARGMKTAVVAEQGAQQQLVTADQEDRDASHMRAVRCSNASMLVTSRGLSHPAAPGRAMTTMSRAGRSALCLRKDSLTRRLIRLRWTADLDTLRDTARPSRADGPGPGAAMTVKQASLLRRPDLNTRVNSAGDRRRCAGQKPCGRADAAGALLTVVPANPDLRRRVGRGPWRAGETAPAGRSWWPCGHGNHGSVSA
jgi:hypothetical protein